MAMANMPQKQESGTELGFSQEVVELIADQIAAGRRPGEIARRLAPHDAARRKLWRERIRNLAYNDSRLAIALGKRAKASALYDLVPSVAAMGQRARRGRMDAVRGVMETTGFHNPRVKHEHSGDISLTLNIPRPAFQGEAQQLDDPQITDADVVEE